MTESFWASWFGEGRTCGNPGRSHIGELDEFYRWISENEDRGICSYSSVQPNHSYETPLCIEKLFFDFDKEGAPEVALEDAKRLKDSLSKFYNAEPLLTFSGNKGYHLYLFLEKSLGYGMVKDHLRPVYGKLQKMVLGKAKYETLDSHVLGDISRLSRVPYTHHQKSGKLCEPLDYQGNLDFYRSHGLRFNTAKQAIYKAGKEEKKRHEIKPYKKRVNTKFTKKLRPCIKTAMEKGHLSHKMRIALVAELHAEGWSSTRIINVFSNFVDFDRRITEYQVKHIIKNNYTPFRCSTIQEFGECLQEKCPIYRRKHGVSLPPITGWGIQRR